MRWCTLLSLLALAACEARLVKVGGASLPEADGTMPAPEGATVVLDKKVVDSGSLPAVPDAPVVRIAADLDVPYERVRSFTLAVQQAGKRPIWLVTKHRKLAALPPTVLAIEESVLLTAEADGKSCIAPPRSDERLCAQHPSSTHVDRASTRSLVRDAVKGYGLTHVHVRLGSGISWADAVRAIDAARTCCRERIEVSIDGLLLQ